ncbi:hypothetical protein M3580_09335 [Bacillus safensis]|uniref:hypothetical protein n=1 Tax=Bacillus safensis TaxID=561879 RepID=UPI002040C6F1|nr:hypothetical protein [Bacillus safensis]MCM2989435.1 hypothetical protein [Bacillus safensis]
MSETAKTFMLKSIHYVTLVGLFILIIPAGINPVIFYIGIILFGLYFFVNVIDSSLRKVKISIALTISFEIIFLKRFSFVQ